jgi:hypothetical protein
MTSLTQTLAMSSAPIIAGKPAPTPTDMHIPANLHAHRDRLLLAHESKSNWRASAVELVTGRYICRLEQLIKGEWTTLGEQMLGPHPYKFRFAADPFQAYATLIRMLREDANQIDAWLHPDLLVVDKDK